MRVAAIIAAGGEGRRIGGAVPKQLLDLAGRSMLERSVAAFAGHDRVAEVVVALPGSVLADPPPWLQSAGAHVRAVAGGARRQDSVANAFDAIDDRTSIVLIHDAARPFVSADLISRSIDAAVAHGAAIAAIPAHDTVKRVDQDVIVETIPRESIFLAQTPQAFRTEILKEAIALGESGVDATDEAALAERAGYAVHIVESTAGNLKITTPDDLAEARRRVEPPRIMAERIGTGYDLHRLIEGKPLLLGGVEIPSPRGATGHSDADVVCHAATDAILGAASLGDIGRHFPDTDQQWKGASSLDLLRRCLALVHSAGFKVVNLDVVVILERPKIAPYLDEIRRQLAGALEIAVDCVSVKGKTNEGVDAVGRGEAIAAHAVALLSAATLNLNPEPEPRT